jgi:hypothetical protein
MANRGFALIARENVIRAEVAAMRRAAVHYCIATGCELWFERLDFDAFERSGRGTSMCFPRPFVRGRIVQHFSLSGGVLWGFIKGARAA